jgi:two-component system response regulator NreC
MDPVQPVESILLVDDHALLRESLAGTLRSSGVFSEVFEAQEGAEATRVAALIQPTLILLDVALPDASGFEVLPAIRRTAPASLVVFLSMHRFEAYAAKAFNLGAVGYLSKSMPFDEVLMALGRALQGERVLDPQLSSQGVSELLGHAQLSNIDAWPKRQLDVLRGLLSGESVASIAAALGIAVKTVESYRSKIFRALGVGSAPELLVKAREEGLDLLIPQSAKRGHF